MKKAKIRVTITVLVKHFMIGLVPGYHYSLNFVISRKLPLKKHRGILRKGPDGDGSCNSPLGFLTVAHDHLYFEICDSQRVTRWKVKEKLKKSTHFGEY